MDDISVLGNAALIPIIIAITQLFKRFFTFKRNADVIALGVSLLVCWGYEFYSLSEADLWMLWGASAISIGKHFIHLMITSFATWLSASKSYDFFLGEKKVQDEMEKHIQEKDELKRQVEDLKSGGDGEPLDEEDAPVDQKIRDILEGR